MHQDACSSSALEPEGFVVWLGALTTYCIFNCSSEDQAFFHQEIKYVIIIINNISDSVSMSATWLVRIFLSPPLSKGSAVRIMQWVYW